MIIYKDILKKLSDAGYNTNRLRKEKLLSEGTIQRLREGKSITMDTLDVICQLTNLQISDLVEFVGEKNE